MATQFEWLKKGLPFKTDNFAKLLPPLLSFFSLFPAIFWDERVRKREFSSQIATYLFQIAYGIYLRESTIILWREIS